MFAFPSPSVEPSFSTQATSDAPAKTHTRVNSSPTRPRDAIRWLSATQRTPSRPRPHLRSLDLASASPPATPSYQSSAFLFAPKSAGLVRTVSSRVPSHPISPSASISLAALNLNPTSSDDCPEDTEHTSITNVVDLDNSPTLKSRPLSFPHTSSNQAATISPSPIKTKLPAFKVSSQRRTFIDCSPVRPNGTGPATPPLTPSSSFASGGTTHSERDEQDSESEDNAAVTWHGSRPPHKVESPMRYAEYEDFQKMNLDSSNQEDSLYFMVGRPQDVYPDMVACRPSPMRTPGLNLPAPDSPTPFRGRRIELSSAKPSRRSTSVSSADGGLSPRQNSQLPSPSSKGGTRSMLFCDIDEMPTASRPQLVRKQRSSSAEPNARPGQSQIDAPINGTEIKHDDPFTTTSTCKEVLHSPKPLLPQPLHPGESHFHGNQSFYGYGYQGYGIAPTTFDHYGVRHHPMHFDHIHGLASPNHITHGPPPPIMGHPAMDAALATAYVNQAQSNAHLPSACPPGLPAIPPAPLWYAPQLSPEPITHDNSLKAFQDPPFTCQSGRSSTLYTNRHAHRGNQRGAKGDYTGRRNFPAYTGRHSPSSSSSDAASIPSLIVKSGASLNYVPPTVPDKNQLDIDAIASGVDTRTTVMIKNIPNKMTDHDLLGFINRPGVCPRRIDFFYLRMDFTNGCNVGYAFVNFILPEDLLHFARTQLGVKWNMYSSEKVLQLSYANYQGKEALVEKFKNSGIMDERPEWRPRIFHSEPGPMQGLPEHFPAPTHLRRKERSANNRGALFVPSPAAAGLRTYHGHSGQAYWAGDGYNHA